MPSLWRRLAHLVRGEPRRARDPQAVELLRRQADVAHRLERLLPNPSIHAIRRDALRAQRRLGR